MTRNFVIASRKEKEPKGEPRHHSPVSFTPISQHVNHPDSGTIKQEGTAGERDMTRSRSPPFPRDEEEPAEAEEHDHDVKKEDHHVTSELHTSLVHRGDDFIAVDLSNNHYAAYNLQSDDESSSHATSRTRVSSSSATPVSATAARPASTRRQQTTTTSLLAVDTKDVVPTFTNNKSSPSRSLAGANAMIVMLKQEQDMRMEDMAELKGQNSELIVDKKELEDMVKDRDIIIAVLQKENAVLIQSKIEAEKKVADLARDLQVAQQAHDILGEIFLDRTSAASITNSQQHKYHHNDDADGGNGSGSKSHGIHGTSSTTTTNNNNKCYNKPAREREAKRNPVVVTEAEVDGTVSELIKPLTPSTENNKTTTTILVGRTKVFSDETAATATGVTATSNCDPSPPPGAHSSLVGAAARARAPHRVQEASDNDLLLDRVRQYWDNPINYPLDKIDLDKVTITWKPRVTDPRQVVMILSNSSTSNSYTNEETTRRFEKGEIIEKGDRGWTVEFPNGDKTNTYKKCLFPHPDLLIQQPNDL